MKLCKKKDKTVNLEGLDSRFGEAENVLVRVFRDHAGEEYAPTITSAKDGKHSKGSIHPEGKAIDLRIRDLFLDVPTYGAVFWQKVEHLCRDLASCLGCEFIVVLEEDHIHLQIGSKNILNFIPGKNLYIKKD